jgi:endonuclease-3
LIAAPQTVRAKCNGKLPWTLAEMSTIPRAGRKTANVVLAALYGVSEGVAVDTHVRRFVFHFDLINYTDPIKIECDLIQVMPTELW